MFRARSNAICPASNLELTRISQWFLEVSHFSEGTPLILVGTETDLPRDERVRHMLSAQGQSPFTPQQGAVVAQGIGARYIECSGSGVQEVFALALHKSMKSRWGNVVKQHQFVVI
jgi:Rho family protein